MVEIKSEEANDEGITSHSLKFYDENKPRLGKLYNVEGRSSKITHPGPHFYLIFMKGATRTIVHFTGLNCGYGGEGPHGLAEILFKEGFFESKEEAMDYVASHDEIQLGMIPGPIKAKEEFRQSILSAEKEELPVMTPKEAFEAGKRGDLSAYDLAGRKVALTLLKFFERHPEINPQQTYYLPVDVHGRQKEGVQIDTVLDEQANKEIDAIGPTGAMFGWALNSVKWLLKVE